MTRHVFLVCSLALLASAGCSEVSSTPAPVAVRPVAHIPPIELQWTDLAFDVGDRAQFDPTKLPDHIRALEGKRVRVRGYFHLGVERREPKEFLLLGEINSGRVPYKWGTPFDELPIHQLAMIEMTPGRTASFTLKPVAITGRLTFEVMHWDGKAFLVFRVIADSVEPVAPRSGYGPALMNGC